MKMLTVSSGWRCVPAGLAALLMLFSMALQPPAWGQDAPAAAATTEAPATAAETPAAETPPPPAPLTTAEIKVMLDTVWVLITGMLVFFMNLGFAAIESGMCRAKNCVNILSKNFIVFAVSTIAFWAIGWGLMFGNDKPEEGKSDGGWYGKAGLLFVQGADNSPATGDGYKGDYASIGWTGVPLNAKFFFQLVFAGTAATIVSGAVAERIKYHTFIVFSFLMGTLIYPIVGHWIWGGGYLASKGFFDFAGSTQVHSLGGWAALAGVIVLGPRIGKYSAEGKVQAIPGHNMSLATIGCLILWFGWFGFNPGSTMGVDPGLMSHVAVTTNTAAAFATITATATAWCLLGKPDIGMTLNGCLAGLVAITAPCAFVSIWSSVIIGSIAGVVVVIAVMSFDRIGIDDPVGATSVHLVNGVFGTLCIGLFTETSLIPAGTTLKAGLFTGGGTDQLIVQAIGVGMCFAYVFPVSLVIWFILKATMGLRVTRQEEIEGLDIGEHGNEAYPGFVMQAPSGH
ncbi:ammonium transporter [Schlesneria paludicola]|uniref:ammonium transporter n=1 Tax=Schlesneria paludicola TaxID=360056 RepID=UPI00029A49B4|nr:ammonium transporter [Schlesneria paludicola]